MKGIFHRKTNKNKYKILELKNKTAYFTLK